MVKKIALATLSLASIVSVSLAGVSVKHYLTPAVEHGEILVYHHKGVQNTDIPIDLGSESFLNKDIYIRHDTAITYSLPNSEDIVDETWEPNLDDQGSVELPELEEPSDVVVPELERPGNILVPDIGNQGDIELPEVGEEDTLNPPLQDDDIEVEDNVLPEFDLPTVDGNIIPPMADIVPPMADIVPPMADIVPDIVPDIDSDLVEPPLEEDNLEPPVEEDTLEPPLEEGNLNPPTGNGSQELPLEDGATESPSLEVAIGTNL